MIKAEAVNVEDGSLSRGLITDPETCGLGKRKQDMNQSSYPVEINYSMPDEMSGICDHYDPEENVLYAGVTAVNSNDLAGHIAGLLGSEEYCYGVQFAFMAVSLHRD